MTRKRSGATSLHDLFMELADLLAGSARGHSERGLATSVTIIATRMSEIYQRGGAALLVENDDLKAMPRMPYGGYCAGVDKGTGARCKRVVPPGGCGYLVGSARGLRGSPHVLCRQCGDELARAREWLPFPFVGE